QNRNEVHGVVRNGSRDHHFPKSSAFFRRVKQRGQNHQVKKISHVRKLHKVVERGRDKLREPHRGIHARQRMIERNEVTVEPERENSVDERVQLLEEKNVERQRIPVARETKNS